jgi:hypothetical protein
MNITNVTNSLGERKHNAAYFVITWRCTWCCFLQKCAIQGSTLTIYDDGGRHDVCIRNMRNVRIISVIKLDGKDLLGATRHMLEDNIKLYLKLSMRIWICLF